jgi:hypothetical protein
VHGAGGLLGRAPELKFHSVSPSSGFSPTPGGCREVPSEWGPTGARGRLASGRAAGAGGGDLVLDTP